MGAAVCLNEPIITTKQQPLGLRYLLHAHRGGSDPNRANPIADAFHARPAYVVSRAMKPHLMYEVKQES
jgi:hypothetical protein